MSAKEHRTVGPALSAIFLVSLKVFALRTGSQDPEFWEQLEHSLHVLLITGVSQDNGAMLHVGRVLEVGGEEPVAVRNMFVPGGEAVADVKSHVLRFMTLKTLSAGIPRLNLLVRFS